MAGGVRVAVANDIQSMVELSAAFRERLEDYEPTFWRRHPDADQVQFQWFGLLLDDELHRVVVSVGDDGRIEGFIIARAMEAPPVYQPGGRTCMIDDFVWSTSAVAEALVSEIQRWAADAGCCQMVIVTPAADSERRTLLEQFGLHRTSEWWMSQISTETAR